ncbi:MAG: sulfatase-like hydrolase/transferase [Pseudomonadota bacterium]
MKDANQTGDRPNILFLFSDEHRSDAMGCAGHGLVKTPALDKLAERGTRFVNAYTPSPICVPARAALASGEYVHRTRCWSNAQAYEGEPKSWGHVIGNAGYRVESIGKLHYRSNREDHGFDHEHLPLYIKGGVGWIKGLLRNHEAVLDCSAYAQEIGSGDCDYTQYDVGVTRGACEWLQSANRNDKQPWSLFVSWLRPHYPLTCPDEFFDLYPLEAMDEARFLRDDQLPRHAVTREIRKNFNYDQHFNNETRQIARAGYYGLCSFLDAQIAEVLSTLESQGLADNTLVVYSSDHGDHNGDRRMWTKMSLYDESTRIPMLIAGPDIPKGREITTLTSLVDIFPTMTAAAGLPSMGDTKPGMPLQELANSSHRPRAILSEYHDGGSPTGMFMLRTDQWKYNYYPGYEPELFNIQDDPDELNDLAGQNQYSHHQVVCHRQLCEIVDPDVANQTAFKDQADCINRLGGIDAILQSEEYDFTPIGS